MSWNLQYMAGKNHVFFYDVPDFDGPDERPTSEEIRTTLEEVARVVRDENPDILLLQEVDDGSKRTDYLDQLSALLLLLPDDYRCWTDAFYHQVPFVPHPRIMGAVGLKLATISKYRITRAWRHALPLMPGEPDMQEYNFKRAILEARLPVDGGHDLVVLNTHLDAFAHGTDTLERQVAVVEAVLDELTVEGCSWVIGGDFNMLPPGEAGSRLRPDQRRAFREQSEIASLYAKYQVIPSLAEINGPDASRWLTHFPNDPSVDAPDRTIDYLILSPDLHLGAHVVRQEDTLHISDHLPIVVTVGSLGPGVAR